MAKLTKTPEDDEHPEHPQGGPPGQTGDRPEHPHGGPPGQNKPEPRTRDTREDEIPPVEPPPAEDVPVWQDFGVQAIQGLYPNLRRGLDWEWGRPVDDPTGEQRLLYWADDRLQPADMAAIQAGAEQLLGADPYADYEAQRGLHRGQVSGHDQGERHRDEGSRHEKKPPQNQDRATQHPISRGGFDPSGGKKPPPDPHFDEHGNRKP